MAADVDPDHLAETVFVRLLPHLYPYTGCFLFVCLFVFKVEVAKASPQSRGKEDN